MLYLEKIYICISTGYEKLRKVAGRVYYEEKSLVKVDVDELYA